MLQVLMDMLSTVQLYTNIWGDVPTTVVDVSNVTQYTLGGLVPGKTILNHWHQDPLFSHVLVIELYNYVHDVTLSHHTQSLPCLFILFTSAIFLISLENLLLFTCCFKVDSIIVVEMDSCLAD